MIIENHPERFFQQTFGVDQSVSPGLSNALSLCLNRHRLIIFQYKICQWELSENYQRTIKKMSIANDPEGIFQWTFGVDQSASPGLSNALSRCRNRNILIILQVKHVRENYQRTIRELSTNEHSKWSRRIFSVNLWCRSISISRAFQRTHALPH